MLFDDHMNNSSMSVIEKLILDLRRTILDVKYISLFTNFSHWNSRQSNRDITIGVYIDKIEGYIM